MRIEKQYKNMKAVLTTKEDGLYRYSYPDDLKLTIYKEGKVKEYKVKYDWTYYIKIQKTQIKSNNILRFMNGIEDNDDANVSRTFFCKMF